MSKGNAENHAILLPLTAAGIICFSCRAVALETGPHASAVVNGAHAILKYRRQLSHRPALQSNVGRRRRFRVVAWLFERIKASSTMLSPRSIFFVDSIDVRHWLRMQLRRHRTVRRKVKAWPSSRCRTVNSMKSTRACVGALKIV